MLTFRAIGDWERGQVELRHTTGSSRRVVPEVEQVIDQTWARVSNRLGVHLFDGPMCRLESFEAGPDALRLTISSTSYRPFVGTNLHNAQLADTHGPDVLANPVGVSTLLETADGYWVLGRRNAAVAYYPNRVHPFAGALEPLDGVDAFAAVFRELREELAIRPADVVDARCLGIVEDGTIRQPELIFTARTSLSRDAVAHQVDRVEHDAQWSIRGNPEEAERAILDPALTPVAKGALLLAGRGRFGTAWFVRAETACTASTEAGGYFG